MRTTIALDPDVEAEVQRLRKHESMGLSEAVNRLARAGLKEKLIRRDFRQESQRMGIQIDVTDVADALEQLEGPASI